MPIHDSPENIMPISPSESGVLSDAQHNGVYEIAADFLATSSESIAVDKIIPRNTLVISFSSRQASGLGLMPFQFFGYMKKYEEVTGETLNKILIRDLDFHYYQSGLRGFSENVTDTVSKLQALKDLILPQRTICVGVSMGAYAAIVYGTYLKADKVMAFAPRSTIERKQSLLYNDKRSVPTLEKLLHINAPDTVWNLKDFLKGFNAMPQIDVYHGCKVDNDSVGAVYVDALYAANLASFEEVNVNIYPYAAHEVFQHLREIKIADDIIYEGISGKPSNRKPKYTGFFKFSDRSHVFGWAYDNANPLKNITLEIMVSGKHLAEVTADYFRSDLLNNGVGDGKKGFNYSFPQSMQEPDMDSVRIKIKDSDFFLKLNK